MSAGGLGFISDGLGRKKWVLPLDGMSLSKHKFITTPKKNPRMHAKNGMHVDRVLVLLNFSLNCIQKAVSKKLMFVVQIGESFLRT